MLDKSKRYLIVGLGLLGAAAVAQMLSIDHENGKTFRGMMGALALGLVNLFGELVGFSVEINPFTAMAVGFLGLPGAAMVIALQLLI